VAFRPLAGVRVLDLTSSLAGPTCTQILGALGADVVKVERPGAGDEARDWGPEFFPGGSVMFFASNADKRSLALDLKRASEVLLRLAEEADVLVQSLRPGAAERLGIGPEPVRARNPRLVYCSIGAYGSRGPLAREPGYDPLMQAFSGILSVTGEPERPGVRAGASLVDIGTGVWAALAILAALRTGEGAHVEISLLETALALLGYHVTAAVATGEPPGRHGTAFPLIVPYQVFATSDGALMVAAANDRLYGALARALDLPDDPRFATNPLRVANRHALVPLLEERFALAPTATWLERLRHAGVPAAPVQDVLEAATHEQVQALGMLEGDVLGEPFSVDGERVARGRTPPLLGEHSAEILAEAGYSDAEVDELVDAGVVGKPPAR
jgi:crotonobetainyl-CoA:carnitine CoA-transferase CaiB-like acyl-CoA transferase